MLPRRFAAVSSDRLPHARAADQRAPARAGRDLGQIHRRSHDVAFVQTITAAAGTTSRPENAGTADRPGFNATPQDQPAIGSVADRQLRSGDDLPGYFVLPNSLGRLQEFANQAPASGEYGGWLGRGADPLTTAVEKKDSKDNPYCGTAAMPS